MSTYQRAVIIGLLGPTIQVIGVIWQVSHMLMSHLHAPMDPRHLVLEGGVLIIGVGLLVTLICVPVAIEVARASEADVQLETFEADAEALPAYAPQNQTASSTE